MKVNFLKTMALVPVLLVGLACSSQRTTQNMASKDDNSYKDSVKQALQQAELKDVTVDEDPRSADGTMKTIAVLRASAATVLPQHQVPRCRGGYAFHNSPVFTSYQSIEPKNGFSRPDNP